MKNQDYHILKYLESMQHLCADIKERELFEFSTKLEVQQFNVKASIFKANQIQNHVVFLSEGLVRAYYLTENGNEKKSWFIGENEFVTDYPSFLTESPSRYFFETIERSTAVFLPKTAIDKGYETYPSLQKYGRLVAEFIIAKQQERIESLLFKSAKQRYIEFFNCPHNFITRVSQKHLASFIGIERQSLTRIRKQIIKGK